MLLFSFRSGVHLNMFLSVCKHSLFEFFVMFKSAYRLCLFSSVVMFYWLSLQMSVYYNLLFS